VYTLLFLLIPSVDRPMKYRAKPGSTTSNLPDLPGDYAPSQVYPVGFA
jgi:hypothetical protein